MNDWFDRNFDLITLALCFLLIVILMLLSGCGDRIVMQNTATECGYSYELNCHACLYIYDDAEILRCRN